ncbi:type 2 lanthipeptide synthetase LanM [uncultured Aquimarina sp.]|uniref:type 2 lanthipeptide synthetase LanM n=1 Tax=uncultured Aquimarina sp. TaxID=575652 RepID=UPI002626D175|nr:type 2 lanthipeptide synthetase LanM [uncultured Aquimarina sp.]
MQNLDFFRELNTATLFPYEKLTHNRKYTSIEEKENFFYIDLLKKSICKNNSEESFKKYCVLNNFSQKDLQVLVSENLHQDKKLADWIYVLEESLEYIDISTISFSKETQEVPFHQLLSPFVELCFFNLRKNLIDKGVKEPTSKVINRLKKTLYKELFILSNAVFFEEFSDFLNDSKKSTFNPNTEEDYCYKKFIEKNIEDKLQTIFVKFPVLARLIATKVHRYTLFVTNLFERFAKDTLEIESHFKVKLGDIKEIHLNAGDQHNGETTAILEFPNSFKLVYKPTNLSITLAYNQFLDWINQSLNENLKSFKILDKSDYGWIEFVKALECKTTKDVKTYYKRTGILSGMAYFLNSRDYHYENVIASGNSPVLIDHETIIGPELKSNLYDKANKSDKTILESMLLPSYEEDITKKCGFGSIKQKNNGNFVFYKIINCNKDNMKKAPQFGAQRNDLVHIPKKDNELQFLENYKSDFFEGLNSFYNLILENKEFLISKESPLEHFENKKIRHIIRPTKVYAKLLLLLNNPKYLKDATAYGLKLELLARTYLMYDLLSIDILGSEREQITLGDIPVFYTISSSDHITLPNGKTANLFEKSAVASVKENIKNACIEDLEHQISLINEVLSLSQGAKKVAQTI